MKCDRRPNIFLSSWKYRGGLHLVSPSGAYTTKSAFRWLDRETTILLTCKENLAWVWRLPLPENLKHFYLLTYRGSLLTNSFRCKRHFSSLPFCCRCDGVEETRTHTLRDFPKAKVIWCQLHFDDNNEFFSIVSILEE